MGWFVVSAMCLTFAGDPEPMCPPVVTLRRELHTSLAGCNKVADSHRAFLESSLGPGGILNGRTITKSLVSVQCLDPVATVKKLEANSR